MLIEILCHYAKTPQFRGALWKLELKMAQTIAWLFCFHGDMDVLCKKGCKEYSIYWDFFISSVLQSVHRMYAMDSVLH